MKWPRAAALVCGAALCTATGVAVAQPEIFWTANGRHLANSLQRVGDGIGVPEPCENAGSRWTCGIEDDPGSGWAADYRLTLNSDECWRGVRVWDPESLVEPEPPEPLAGCLNVLDYVKPW